MLNIDPFTEIEDPFTEDPLTGGPGKRSRREASGQQLQITINEEEESRVVPVPNDFSSNRKRDDSPESLAKLRQDSEWLQKLHQSCQWADLKLACGGVITGFFVPKGLAQNIRNDVCTPSTWLSTFLDGLFPRITCAHFGVAITRRNEQITPSTRQVFSFDPLGIFMPKRTSPTLEELFKLKQLGQTTFQNCWRCNRATPPDNCFANARMILVPGVE